MGNFELLFSLEARRKRGNEWVMGDSGLVKRIITANDKETAEKLRDELVRRAKGAKQGL